MGITLAQMAARRADYVVHFEDGGVLKGQFFPDRLSSKVIRLFQSFATLNTDDTAAVLDSIDQFTAALAHLLVPDTWNIYDKVDASGEPLPDSVREPTSVDTLESMGIQAQTAIYYAIIEASNQSKSTTAAQELSATLPVS